MFDAPRLLTTGLPELLHHHLGLRVDDAQATTRAIATEYAIRPRMDLEWRLPEPTRPVSFAALLDDTLPAMSAMSVRHAEVRFARLRHSDVPGREVCGPVRLVGFDGAAVWTWTPELPRYDWPHVAEMLGGFGLLADGQRADFLDLAPWWSIVPGKAAVALYALAEAHTLVVARDPEGFPRLRVTPVNAFSSWEPRAQALDAFNRALDDVNDVARGRTPSRRA